jgi:hypothetical protein
MAKRRRAAADPVRRALTLRVFDIRNKLCKGMHDGDLERPYEHLLEFWDEVEKLSRLEKIDVLTRRLVDLLVEHFEELGARPSKEP